MPTPAVLNANLAFDAQSALGIGQQLQRSIQGDAKKVHIIVNGVTTVEFDAVISESYNQDAAPTAFPIEDGGMVSDHIIVAPRELAITGIVSDSPIDDRKSLITEGITTAVSRLTGPLGVVVAATAFASAKAIAGSKSPSVKALDELLKLAGGDRDGPVPTAPVPFTVVTRLRRYTNMVIRSLQVPRDASTGNALVFNLSLIQIRLVHPQQTVISLQKLPQVSQGKELEKKAPNKVAAAGAAGFKDGLAREKGAVAAIKDFVGAS